jgi:hypothetical protein
MQIVSALPFFSETNHSSTALRPGSETVPFGVTPNGFPRQVSMLLLTCDHGLIGCEPMSP